MIAAVERACCTLQVAQMHTRIRTYIRNAFRDTQAHKYELA